ncbi:hypothetical protein LV779_22035 [Streptomyces thinghirensis]|nr:hypothetical protein [Streptomyces thinghirensis]
MTTTPVLSARRVRWLKSTSGTPPALSSPPPLPPFRPEDYDEHCEACGAPPGQLCHAWCDTGYTAADARAEAESVTPPRTTPSAQRPPCRRN